MSRKFESEYRITKVDEILKKENAFRQDVDMRLDAIERGVAALGSDADVLVARVLRVIELEISPRAAEIEALLSDYRDGVPAASVEEEPDGRQFLTPDRRSAIVNELRGGADGSGDTLAKLLTMIGALDAAKATPADITGAIEPLAPLDSPVFTNTPRAPTPALDTNTNQLATTAFVWAVRNALSSAIASALSGKASKSGDSFSGDISTTGGVSAASVAATGRMTAGEYVVAGYNVYAGGLNGARLQPNGDLWMPWHGTTGSYLSTVLLSKQPALGFTPVQQGTGIGQDAGPIIKIGYSQSLIAIKAAVDNYDFGKVWTDHEAPASIGGSGYMKLPNNMILQWGTFGGGDVVVTFPTAFPNICVAVCAQLAAGLTAGESVSAAVDQVSKWQFSKRGRYANSGGVVGSAVQPGYYIAIGY